MRASFTGDPTEICENILREEIRYNIEHDILRSENQIAERLLSRRIELREAYAELYKKLLAPPPALEIFLGSLLSTAAFWSPEKIAKSREDRKRLEEVNQEIAEKGHELSRLLRERDSLNNHSAFHSETYYGLIEMIDDASSQHGRYNLFLREPLTALSCQYDLKYWPSLSDCILALSRNAADGKVRASDPLTEVATKAMRRSLADFLKAFIASLEEQKIQNGGLIPSNFRLGDASIASLVNCALDLSVTDMIDAAYVKRFRQRERSRS
ncbi:MAG: hypothetical protein KDJ29_13925 [Hyphomicrobiales bacterium]|nr:hypothetical protein [Nitratireductor sp.]MCC2097991.1 hypothetical protein [Hyphomicrobiales bacterium]